MKTLIPFVLLLCSITASCQKEKSIPDDKLTIGVMSYTDSISKLPVQAINYLLRIQLMQNVNSHDDLLYKWLYYDTVKTSQPLTFTPSSPQAKNNLFTNLAYGRYIISVQKDNKEAISEVIYNGGDIQINLILK